MTRTATRPPEAEPQLLEELGHLADPRAIRERFFAKARLFWSRRRLLARACAIGLICATLLAFFIIPKRFESQARLMPPDSQSSGALALVSMFAGSGQAGGSGGGSLGSLAGDLLGMKSSGALFIGVLRSRTVEDRIVDQFSLKKIYGSRFQDTARLTLEENTEINEDRKNGIISLTVRDRDPKRAAAIATAYVHELDSAMAVVSTSSARRERIFLEQRLEKVKQDLESAENNFSEFASKNGAIDIPAQGKAMVQAGAALEGELIAAQSQLEGLKSIYTGNNIRVRSTEARVAELKRQLNKLSGPGNTHPADDPSSSGADYPALRQLPVLGVPWADLFREVKIEESVFEILTKQYELAKIQEAKEIPTVKVLDAPLVPEHKSYPPRLLIMFVGTCLSLILTMSWILAEARWHETADHDPGKQLAQEIFESAYQSVQSVRARVPRLFRNGPQADIPVGEVEEHPEKNNGEPRT